MTSSHSGRSKPSVDSATKKDPPDHPSPSAVLRKISGIITRSHSKEEHVDKKETNKVEKRTELDNKTIGRITRSQNVISTGNLSQPLVTENEAGRMRTRSQSSDKSEMSSKSMKTFDTTHDATMDVTVSLLNLNIDANKKYMISPSGKMDDRNTHGVNTPTRSQRKRPDTKEDTTDDVSKNKRQKEKSTEDNKKQNDPGNDTDSHNLDEVEPVNSDNGARGENIRKFFRNANTHAEQNADTKCQEYQWSAK